MGQQQLILLVLATVIVGIAIVIGIRAFTENGIRANSDAMVQDMVRIASDAQAWKQKPAPFGGQIDDGGTLGGDKNVDADFRGLTFTAMGYPAVSGLYENLNGRYTLSGVGATGFTIVGCNEIKDNWVEIDVTGITDSEISNDQVALKVGNKTAACPTP